MYRSARDRAEAAERDAEEQARLVGIGMQRELALTAKLEAAAKERDAALMDAERYRWLRGHLFAMDSDYCAPDGIGVVFKFPSDARIGKNSSLDAAIDAARKK